MNAIIPLKTQIPPVEIAPNTSEWYEWRRGGIGGSDAAVITGDDPYRQPLTLWLDKCGYLERDADDDDDTPQWWGKRLEQSVIDRFELDSGLVVIQRGLCIEHHLDRWRRATLDGLVVEGGPTGYRKEAALGIYEGKVTSKLRDWVDGPPAYVQIQVQHNLDVAEVDNAWLGVLFTAPVVNFKLFEIQRDESICGPLRAMEARFWQRVLEHDRPPAQAEDLDALKRAFRENDSSAAIELDTYNEQHPLEEPIEAIIAELIAARAAKSSAEHREDTAQAMLASLLMEHETGTIGGVPVIRWAHHEKTHVDVDAMRAAHPKIVEQFTSKRPYRQFSVPKGGANGRDSLV